MRKMLGNLYHSLFYKGSSLRPLKIFKKTRKRDVELPDDDSFLSDQEVQWWYWTGHLQDENGKRYGFEIAFFAFDSWIIFKNQLAQAAITDISHQCYHYREEVEFCSLPKKLNGKFNLGARSAGREVISACGASGQDSLYCEIDDYILDIHLKSMEEPVIHYDGKLHPYSFGGYTYYYARERMQTSGTIKIKGKSYRVEGISWFDRQYGDLYHAIFKGWQWFAIELFDGPSIMLYDFIEQDCETERFGSITDKNKQQSTVLHHHQYEVIVLDTWQCPHTRIKFPSGWKIKLEDIEFTIEPLVKDQTLKAKHIFWIGPEYWEGACNVFDENDNVIGQAYVELNGFAHRLLSIEVAKQGNIDVGI